MHTAIIIKFVTLLTDFDHGTLIFVGVFCVSSLVIIFTIGRKMLLRMVNKTANEEVC